MRLNKENIELDENILEIELAIQQLAIVSGIPKIDNKISQYLLEYEKLLTEKYNQEYAQNIIKKITRKIYT